MTTTILTGDNTVLLNGTPIAIIPNSVELDFGLNGYSRVAEVLNGEVQHVGIPDISKNVGMIKFSTYSSEDAIKIFKQANAKNKGFGAGSANVVQITFKSNNTVIVGTNMTLISGLSTSLAPDAELVFEFEGNPLSDNLV
jgi:hypothetical protein